MYLPQFHQIPENDEWWGKGFTEWTNVKKAKPLFEGHYQPRIPLKNNYYDLTDVESLKWQCEIAKKHDVYGFCFYHYWFNSRLLLEKPMEMLLKNPDIDINYCVSWANHNWEDSWKASQGREKTLISHDFDNEEDWVKHFDYLLPFFKDPRYILEDNKPLLIIYIPNIISKLNKMLTLWNKMAIDAGFDGLKYAFQSAMSHHSQGWDRSMFDYAIEFQPGYINFETSAFSFFNIMKYSSKIKEMLGIKSRLQIPQKSVAISDYDSTWQKIIDAKPSSKNAVPSAFVDWDNTPRKIEAGRVYLGATPSKFKYYFKQLLLKAKYEYKTDKIFVFAWNEWAEGGYLEPDEKFSYGYLEAIKEALKEHDEFSDS